ncbi:hypothetical protein [Austwickia chelonae]|uniref:hypothetical protein n=1 Tax=Austwickia chelonae TaxID=100225 RepID=UPI0013C2F974|nr:hypothetical protein [Austwickia chelonae]
MSGARQGAYEGMHAAELKAVAASVRPEEMAVAVDAFKKASAEVNELSTEFQAKLVALSTSGWSGEAAAEAVMRTMQTTASGNGLASSSSAGGAVIDFQQTMENFKEQVAGMTAREATMPKPSFWGWLTSSPAAEVYFRQREEEEADRKALLAKVQEMAKAAQEQGDRLGVCAGMTCRFMSQGSCRRRCRVVGVLRRMGGRGVGLELGLFGRVVRGLVCGRVVRVVRVCLGLRAGLVVGA